MGFYIIFDIQCVYKYICIYIKEMKKRSDYMRLYTHDFGDKLHAYKHVMEVFFVTPRTNYSDQAST